MHAPENQVGPFQRRRTLPLGAGDRNGFAHGARRSRLPVVDWATFADYGTAIGTLVLRNVGAGLAVLHGWGFEARIEPGRHSNLDHPDPR